MEKFSKKIILISLLLYSCVISTKEKNHYIFEKRLINDVNTDSIADLGVFMRTTSLIVARYRTGEIKEQNGTTFHNYIQFLCKRGEDRVLKVKYDEMNWVSIDSLHMLGEWDTYNYMFEDVKYSVNVLIDLNLLEIRRGIESDKTILFLTRDSYRYYYSSDSDLIQKFEINPRLIKLNSNWWKETSQAYDNEEIYQSVVNK